MLGEFVAIAYSLARFLAHFLASFRVHFPAVVVGSFLLVSCTAEAPREVADLVVLDARIATLNPAQPSASALVVRGGKIVHVGDSETARQWIGRQTRVLRPGSASVWPGLIDSHIHLMQGALSMDACTAEDAYLPLDKVAPIILECVARTPGDGWVVVENVNAAGFTADRKALDAIVANRPLLLWAADGHVGWGNSMALEKASVNAQTRDPDGGRIERRNGEPTGFLVDNALNLISHKLDKPTPEQRLSALRRALQDLAAVGITTFLEANTDAANIDTYLDLAARRQLNARVTFALQSSGANTDEEFTRLGKLRRLAETHPGARADVIKLFEDGVIEHPTQTAALLEPYLESNGKPGKRRGPLYHEPDALKAFARRAASEGFGLHIHVIGDRAVRVALDAFADARAQGSKLSYSLTHLELVDPADLPRFRELDVIASMQLQWAQPDNYTEEAALPYIGAERQRRLYPAGSLAAAGATIAGGSDWNVSTFNPFEAMAVAMSRVNPKEPQRGMLGPDQKLTLQQMLAAYTVNAARMLGRDKEVGSLEVGKAGNFIVLDRELGERSTADEVRATRVVYTFADGKMLTGPKE